MKSTQDRIPTHRLGPEMATDAQGRVLRRPHFMTTREHQDAMRRAATDWIKVVTHETAQVKEARANVRVVRSRIFCRSRLHWVLRLIIKID